MRSSQPQSSGFTLIASLLLLLLLSGIAIGLMMMVGAEATVGGSDLQNNAAYHSAEGGIEKMTADLAGTFQNAQSPTAAQICNLSNLQPSMPGVTWRDYSVTPASGCSGLLAARPGQILSGPNQGLWAQIIPVTMLATASEPGGQEVSMTRTAQVALIPVFQFGVFSEGDLGFFSGPNFDFAGRVHTNGDLYPEVGPGSTLTFHDKVSVYGNVIRAVLANGYSTASQYNGTVDLPAASGGCDGSKPNCKQLGLTDGSVTGAGGNPPQSGPNNNWPNVSLTTFNGEIINGGYDLNICGASGTAKCGTGAKRLSMPFVNGTNFPYQIIRRPPPLESTTSGLAQSREYNMAQIRVLLSDDPAELPGGANDTGNVRLSNGPNPGPDYTKGVPVPIAGHPTWTTYFAEGTTSAALNNSTGYNQCLTAVQLAALQATPDWPIAPADAGANQTLTPVAPKAPLLATAGTWNLLDGYLRVEYKDAAGTWNAVTREWLELGFARGLTPPTAAQPNPVHPNAILLLQQPADRNGNGAIDPAGSGCSNPTPRPRPAELLTDGTTASVYYGDNSQATSVSRDNWYPINFYDVREGEARDNATANASCTANGVMNAVEIDVGNLKKWLAGQIGANGTNVDYLTQNGYVLYFSDRRGMLPNPNSGNAKTGDAGLEDDINASSAAGTPDGVREPIPSGKTLSPEDVNQNGILDNFGAANLGLGFYGTGGVAVQNLNASIVLANPDNPYIRIDSCSTTGRKNWVSGARHALRLVDGSLGKVPLRTDAAAPNTGGFTVASENPVYILGDYNSNSADTTWGGGADQAGHAASAVIADSVTLLSNSWLDLNSMTGQPTSYAGRTASNTWYRVAIAGGKNINFPQPTWNGVGQDFGTDGGVHNFLRYLENWSGKTLHYKGSLVSLYYANYDTGIYKCCTIVYSPPTRDYIFDQDFSTPAGLPPGTPLFRDVDSLGYRQLFTARTY
ncbi:MAG: hypothetical protein LAO56_08830 [Acidobacteriia bacterium]|nr:hypothetical protein [Terriglobia bacterium]